ncbi:MAG: cytochrome c-type biosis protein CcmE [Thermoleophilaceae bacterium]|jgi:cytochrome c-type biogenesis protein CcmE|nr:cytochrome c-type biosis protein CcmE [Thermoleophilaceae bacterium]
MNPQRKRTIRLVVALTAAVLLGGALVYTSFSGASEARKPSQIVNAKAGQSYKVTGKVVNGSIRRVGGAEGETVYFRVRDRDGQVSVPVVYRGIVPDPFRDNREILLTGQMRDGTFVGQRDTLVTKCPSKFKNKPNGSTL